MSHYLVHVAPIPHQCGNKSGCVRPYRVGPNHSAMTGITATRIPHALGDRKSPKAASIESCFPVRNADQRSTPNATALMPFGIGTSSGSNDLSAPSLNYTSSIVISTKCKGHMISWRTSSSESKICPINSSLSRGATSRHD